MLIRNVLQAVNDTDAAAEALDGALGIAVSARIDLRICALCCCQHATTRAYADGT